VLHQESANRKDAAQRVQPAPEKRMPLAGAQGSDS